MGLSKTPLGNLGERCCASKSRNRLMMMVRAIFRTYRLSGPQPLAPGTTTFAALPCTGSPILVTKPRNLKRSSATDAAWSQSAHALAGSAPTCPRKAFSPEQRCRSKSTAARLLLGGHKPAGLPCHTRPGFGCRLLDEIGNDPQTAPLTAGNRRIGHIAAVDHKRRH